MYRSIETSIWTDPKFRTLSPEGKLFFMYLITNPHAHVSGIYYLPAGIITHETQLSGRGIDTLWHTLSSEGIVRRDAPNDVVWVVNMLRYQGYKGGKSSKLYTHVSKHLPSLHNSRLIQEFCGRYPEFHCTVRDTPSIPHRYPIEGVCDQEQDQEQDQESLSASADPPSKPSKPKKVPNPNHTPLREHFKAGWKELYQAEYKCYAKENKHIATILGHCDNDLSRAMKVIDAYLANRDRWFVENRHGLNHLVSQIHKFIASGPPRTAPAQLAIYGEV